MNALKIAQRRWSGTFVPTRLPPVLLASESASRESLNVNDLTSSRGLGLGRACGRSVSGSGCCCFA